MKLRDVIIFAAGAEFFHTISHMVMPYFIHFPMHLKYMVFTTKMNMIAIVINALITILLLWWAKCRS